MKMTSIIFLCLLLPIFINAQWIQTSLNPNGGYSLYSNDTTLFAGTDRGVYYTNDIGEPWFSIGPANEWIFSVITAGNKVIAGSDSKGIWITSDLGLNWTHPSGIDGQSVHALCKNNKYLFAGTWGGGVFRSEDDGSSWYKVGLDGEGVLAVLTIGDTIFAGSSFLDENGTKVFRSFNNGNTWDFSYLSYPVTTIYSFVYKDGKVFTGTDGGLYSSNDFGDTWSLEYGATFDSDGNAIDTKTFEVLISYNEFLITSIMFNSIWISSNNGKNWSQFNEGIFPDWSFSGLAVKDTNLWALRKSFGNAYRRPIQDLLTTYLNTEMIILPSDYILYQNYPNPFNPSTVIKYGLPENSNVTLEIFNTLGQSVGVLVDAEKPAGFYEAAWNASNLSSGIYLIKIKAIGTNTKNNFIKVKKAILIK